MHNIKRTLQILFKIIFFVQLTGCIFVDHDHWRDRDSSEHHEHEHDHDSGVDIRVHGE